MHNLDMKHLLLICFVFWSACAEKSKEVKAQFDAYVRFMEEESALKAEATIRENDLAVEIPGGISYLEVGMTLMPIRGVTYKIEYPSGYRPEHSFAWKDFKGRYQKFDFRMSPITAFELSPRTPSRTQPATLRWEGGPAERGEVIVFMWENSALNLTIPMEVIPGIGQSSIDIPAAKMSMLSAGEWTLYLVRKKLSKGSLANQTACTGISEFYTVKQPLTILP